MASENELRSLSRKRQSPIDIIDCIARPKRLPPLRLVGHWLNEGEATLTNDKASRNAVIKLSGNRIPSIVKCGPLSDEYEFHSAHFHWGEDDCHGSEHSLNGTWFSMEAHAVHWNRKYRTFEDCLKFDDGICVLAYFFLVKNECDCGRYTSIDKITEKLKCIRNVGSEVKIPANSLYWMLVATECKYYYYYKGSFNMYDYPECAIWIVFPNAISIRSDQIAEFRKLRDANNNEIRHHQRELQHLNDRKIFKAI